MDFNLSIKSLQGKRLINFVNNSSKFVEVIFTIDGKEVREGKDFSESIKGYAYPPKLEKTVKKMDNGSALPFNDNGGEIVAYIFSGFGKYRDEDLEKPTFLRHKMVNKVKFTRNSNQPIEILKIKY